MLTTASASVSRKRLPKKTLRPRLGNTWQDLRWRAALIVPVLNAPITALPAKPPRKRRREIMATE
jgi:hypothetical protein